MALLHSLLGEDFWVTTATFALPDRAPHPPRSSHRKVEKVSFAAQAAEHASHVGVDAAEGGPHETPATMAEFLPLIDRFNARAPLMILQSVMAQFTQAIVDRAFDRTETMLAPSSIGPRADKDFMRPGLPGIRHGKPGAT